MSELLNLVGLITGIVLYAVLFAMVLGPNPSARTPRDPLLLATALLGLAWNLCALPTYELQQAGIAGPVPLLSALGFAALGFLPAVVVHSVARGERGKPLVGARYATVAGAYAISAVAALLHLQAAVLSQPVPSELGMRMLTYAFVVLVLPLVTVTRGQPGSRRALWVAALAIFAVSALHLSQLHKGDASWPVELLGHHASLPLALAILYQDYPFALADLFLKRALALLAMVVLAFFAVLTLGGESEAFARFMQLAPRQVVLLVSIWVGTAFLYPALRDGASWFVDRVILRRPDYFLLRSTVLRDMQAREDVPALLTALCDALVPALSATTVTWREGTTEEAADVSSPLNVSGSHAMVLLPTGDTPRFAIDIVGLTGGRRLLSDDRVMLETLAVAVARRIDAIRLTAERYTRELREQEIGKLATEAELRALRAQVNPHFLFNALTTIGYLIQTAPPRALETLLRLTALLRAVLRPEGEFTTLGREIELVEAYLEIEQARFEERLRTRIDVPPALRDVSVPPLVLQPIVENAVKHGLAPRLVGGEIEIRARLTGQGTDEHVFLSVHDTGVGATPEGLALGRLEGVGLRNVERRLECHYGQAASLVVRSVPGVGTTVEIRLPAVRRVAPDAKVRRGAR